MIKIIVAMKDNAVNVFNNPVFLRNPAEAVRGVTDEVNDPKTELHKHHKDYDLYQLGLFDEETGQITGLERPERIVRCQDLITNKE